jgi:ribosomal protein S13
MAGLASTAQVLVRIRFRNAAADMICDQQGIDELSEIKILTDSEIECLCKVVRHPGGTIVVNPNAATTGQPATLYASGESISMIA